MMRKHRRPATEPVSLFPFLAVLICTMGSLVMLLVLAVKAAEQTADATSETEKADAQIRLSQIKDLIETREIMAQAIFDQRAMIQEELADARKRRGHVEEQVRILVGRLQELDQSLQTAASEIHSADTEKSEEYDLLIAELETELSKINESLATLRDKPPEMRVEYQISLQPTAHGTNRLPIFIECTDSQIIFQPSNIQIRPSDLPQELGPGNPIDAALLAVREYYARAGLTNQNEPYPLIVVRPGGEAAYAVVRRAMVNWDDEFGYELVDQEHNLVFGKPDPAITSVIVDAIEYSKRRQANGPMMADSRNGGNNVAPVSFRANGDSAEGSAGERTNTGTGLLGGDQTANFAASAVRSQSEQDFSDQRRSEFRPSNSPVNERNIVNSAQGNQSQNPEKQNTQSGGSDTVQSVSSDLLESKRSTDPLAEAQVGNGIDREIHRDPSQYASQNRSADSSTSNPSFEKYVKDAQQWYRQTEQNPGASNKHGRNQGSQASNGQLGQCSCIADTRGKNWALPSVRTNGTAFRRPVLVHVSNSGFALTESNSTILIDVPDLSQQSTQNAAEQLVKNIWDVIDSWGYAGADSYWKPELRVTVSDNGESHFLALQQLLDRSGLDIKRTDAR
jgi:hypothetical protein